MKLFVDEEINTGRQIEVDIAKFVCLFGMVIVHCFDVFVSFSELSGGVEYIFGVVLNSVFGAGTFMFCMGLGIAYSGSNTPELLMKRGVKIFLIGYLLNLACALSYLILLRDITLFVTYALGLDILQFAGLALFLFGALKRWHCPDWGIGALGVVMSLVGTFVREIDLGNAAANIFMGLFIGTFDRDWMTGGIFPLLNWFIFVAAGYLFAQLLRRCTDKAKLYRLISPAAGVVIAVYLLIAVPGRLGMMGSVLRINQMEIQEALVCLAGAVFALGVYCALSNRMPERIKRLITGVSKNINAIYCEQWVIIAWTVSIWVILGHREMSDGVIMLLGAAIFLLSALLAECFRKWKTRRERQK